MVDKVKECSRYFRDSPKREGLLVQVISKSPDSVHNSKRKALIDMCRTRWASRHNSFKHFYQAYCYLVEALGVIAHNLNAAKYPDYGGWDPKSRQMASSLLTAISCYDFIITFLTVYQYLSHLSGITVKLQGRTVDILEAYREIDDVKSTYKVIREEVVQNFDIVLGQGERMATTVGTSAENPRSAGRMMNRANAPAETVKEYYLRNLVMPFLDYICSELDGQFSTHSKTAVSLITLTPVVISTKTWMEVIDLLTPAIELYKDDLPSPEIVEMELRSWLQTSNAMPEEERPDSIGPSLKLCSATSFPNLHVLLCIAATLPVTSCECERSASALRRLHTFMRASMTEERLSSLALAHIHYDDIVETDTVVDIFAKKHPRRLQLDNILGK